MERLIEYLLESAGAAMLLMVKEAIVLTVGWFTRARKREEVEGLAIETRLSASWTSATLSGRDCSWIGQQSWKSRFKRPSKRQSKWSDGVTVLISFQTILSPALKSFSRSKSFSPPPLRPRLHTSWPAPFPMKQRAAKKKQTKKVKAAKAKAKAARRAAAAGDDVAMDAVANADADVEIAEADSDAKPAGRAAHALKVQARRALKLKIDNLKGKRSKIAKRDIGNKPTRKALSSTLKGLLATKKHSGDDAAELLAAANAPEDDDDCEEDVEMAA